MAWLAAFSECLSGTDSDRLSSEPASSGGRARDGFTVDFFVHGRLTLGYLQWIIIVPPQCLCHSEIRCRIRIPVAMVAINPR
jgi:hypothetical protein